MFDINKLIDIPSEMSTDKMAKHAFDAIFVDGRDTVYSVLNLDIRPLVEDYRLGEIVEFSYKAHVVIEDLSGKAKAIMNEVGTMISLTGDYAVVPLFDNPEFTDRLRLELKNAVITACQVRSRKFCLKLIHERDQKSTAVMFGLRIMHTDSDLGFDQCEWKVTAAIHNTDFAIPF